MAMVESAGSVAVVGAGIIGWRRKYSKKTFEIAKDCFLTSAQRESFSISGQVGCGTNYQVAGLVQVGKVFPGFSE